MQNKDVLVAGAGIAGCAMAYWLREYGFRPTVVERAPAPRPGGQTVDLRGAGRTVVDRMGLRDAVRAMTIEQRGLAWIDADGRHRAEMPVEAFGGNGIVSAEEILRGDLSDVLYGAAQDGVEFLFDDTVTAISQDDDGVDVTFENAPQRRFALVVGADGMHSAVRRAAFGPSAEFFRPLGLLTAWFTVPAEVDLDGWYLMHNDPGGRVASLRPGRLPSEQKAGLSVRSDEVVNRRDRAAQVAFLERSFADVGWEAQRLVRQARDAEDLYLESMGQVRMSSWSTGRVVLVGDAGYCPTPLTGLGTSLALVGAYVLAGELAGASTHAEAFAGYERVLRPYVTQAQELPPSGVDGYAPRGALRVRTMRASMRWAQRWPMRPMMDRIFAKADAIELPSYGW
ncbi:FAD-dependent monooxygenase [Pseudonocardia endophytica]|uniref:2-polyprenyl-6-methoxyphenol hydroxylase-like FAD-dependent oxidoreductase n=1 Tax=Pseudonocardia endophytica TaxID=401976 RepID=A0A4R1HLE8_PSEEN|nr:FAD-dependent monooxygenase [Pseudonocardia endophytica]TCK20429.1 2-polyprenyl-6-methoxyphenol hydroxylase-like FAD-dependent oxidoreductase [Pseudonocardia endophytica]